MPTRWIPASEALARAGGLRLLLPYLIDGRIRARAESFLTKSGRPFNRKSEFILPEWWEPDQNPRLVEIGTGRFVFATGPYVAIGDHPAEDITAIGVEFEAIPIEKEKRFSPPVLPEPVPRVTNPAAIDPQPKLKPGPKLRGIGGNRRGPIWNELILPFLQAKFDKAGPFVDGDAAIFAARECVRNDSQKRTLDKTTITRGMRKWCPLEWVAKPPQEWIAARRKRRSPR